MVSISWPCDLPASASQVAGTTGVCHHTQLFLVETGFHHVDQYGLHLLTSWSTRLGLPKCWDYRREPPRPAARSVFKKTNKLSFRMAVAFYMPTSNVSVVKFLYILTSIWCCLHLFIYLLTYLFIYGDRSHYVAQAGIKLLCSSHPPASTS